MKDYKNMEDVSIVSSRIAEIIIAEIGIKPLKKIKYYVSENEKTHEKSVRRVYIFKNSDELYSCMEKYMFTKEVNK